MTTKGYFVFDNRPTPKIANYKTFAIGALSLL